MAEREGSATPTEVDRILSAWSSGLPDSEMLGQEPPRGSAQATSGAGAGGGSGNDVADASTAAATEGASGAAALPASPLLPGLPDLLGSLQAETTGHQLILTSPSRAGPWPEPAAGRAPPPARFLSTAASSSTDSSRAFNVPIAREGGGQIQQLWRSFSSTADQVQPLPGGMPAPAELQMQALGGGRPASQQGGSSALRMGPVAAGVSMAAASAAERNNLITTGLLGSSDAAAAAVAAAAAAAAGPPAAKARTRAGGRQPRASGRRAAGASRSGRSAPSPTPDARQDADGGIGETAAAAAAASGSKRARSRQGAQQKAAKAPAGGATGGRARSMTPPRPHAASPADLELTQLLPLAAQPGMLQLPDGTFLYMPPGLDHLQPQQAAPVAGMVQQPAQLLTSFSDMMADAITGAAADQVQQQRQQPAPQQRHAPQQLHAPMQCMPAPNMPPCGTAWSDSQQYGQYAPQHPPRYLQYQDPYSSTQPHASMLPQYAPLQELRHAASAPLLGGGMPVLRGIPEPPSAPASAMHAPHSMQPRAAAQQEQLLLPNYWVPSGVPHAGSSFGRGSGQLPAVPGPAASPFAAVSGSSPAQLPLASSSPVTAGSGGWGLPPRPARSAHPGHGMPQSPGLGLRHAGSAPLPDSLPRGTDQYRRPLTVRTTVGVGRPWPEGDGAQSLQPMVLKVAAGPQQPPAPRMQSAQLTLQQGWQQPQQQGGDQDTAGSVLLRTGSPGSDPASGGGQPLLLQQQAWPVAGGPHLGLGAPPRAMRAIPDPKNPGRMLVLGPAYDQKASREGHISSLFGGQVAPRLFGNALPAAAQAPFPALQFVVPAGSGEATSMLVDASGGLAGGDDRVQFWAAQPAEQPGAAGAAGWGGGAVLSGFQVAQLAEQPGTAEGAASLAAGAALQQFQPEQQQEHAAEGDSMSEDGKALVLLAPGFEKDGDPA